MLVGMLSYYDHGMRPGKDRQRNAFIRMLERQVSRLALSCL